MSLTWYCVPNIIFHCCVFQEFSGTGPKYNAAYKHHKSITSFLSHLDFVPYIYILNIWYFKILHVEILNHLYFKLEKLKRDPLLFCSDRHVGKIYSKCSSFLDYVRMSLKKLGLDESKVSVWLPFSFTRILGRAVNWNNTRSFAFY